MGNLLVWRVANRINNEWVLNSKQHNNKLRKEIAFIQKLVAPSLLHPWVSSHNTNPKLSLEIENGHINDIFHEIYFSIFGIDLTSTWYSIFILMWHRVNKIIVAFQDRRKVWISEVCISF